MPRKRRINRSNAFYHVILRGNNGKQIFFDKGDFYRLCFFIQEGVERHPHEVHAFCLMSNHIHLVIKTAHTPLSKIVHHLAFRYASYFNFKNESIGHLFQGRFRSILVEDSVYLLRLIRYIHLNPVRAHIVKCPEEYLWSSHRTYLGLNPIVWVESEHILKKFHEENKQKASRKYVDYVLAGIKDDDHRKIAEATHQGMVLGNEEWAKEQLECLNKPKVSQSSKNQLKRIIEIACKHSETTPDIVTGPLREKSISQLRGLIVCCVRCPPKTGHWNKKLIKSCVKVFSRTQKGEPSWPKE